MRNVTLSDGEYLLPSMALTDGLPGDTDAVCLFLLRHFAMLEAQDADGVVDLRTTLARLKLPGGTRAAVSRSRWVAPAPRSPAAPTTHATTRPRQHTIRHLLDSQLTFCAKEPIFIRDINSRPGQALGHALLV
jgi:hypothetical protein